MTTQVPDLLEPPRLTGNTAFDSQAMVNYSWDSYRALRVALNNVASLGTIATQDASNVNISGGTIEASVSGSEQTSHKNAASGYAGLSVSYQIQFKNTAGTFTNLLTNASTATRTYTFPDGSGVLAFVTDVDSAITNALAGGTYAAAFTTITLSGVQATSAAAPTIASGTTIAPTTAITFISGTTTIQTITPPAAIAGKGGQIILVPTEVWATGTSGNIALATTAVVAKALILVFDSATNKWYPSY